MTDTVADKDFLEFLIKAIVDNPDDVVVERKIDEMGVLLLRRPFTNFLWWHRPGLQLLVDLEPDLFIRGKIHPLRDHGKVEVPLWVRSGVAVRAVLRK